jgi:ubiquinone biosynthesis protein
MLQVEGLGRQLDPDLDLRRTAQPILERWMDEQMGWRAVARRVKDEAPEWARTLPQLPRLVHAALASDVANRLERALLRIELAQHRQARVLGAIALVLLALAVAYFLR